MNDEMHFLNKNKTWDLDEKRTDRKIITCKWVLGIKYDPQGQHVRFKARLVSRSFTQVPGIDFTDIFSPTLRMSSFRLLVVIVVAQKLELPHLDIQTAFLLKRWASICVFTPKNYEKIKFSKHPTN